MPHYQAVVDIFSPSYTHAQIPNIYTDTHIILSMCTFLIETGFCFAYCFVSLSLSSTVLLDTSGVSERHIKVCLVRSLSLSHEIGQCFIMPLHLLIQIEMLWSPHEVSLHRISLELNNFICSNLSFSVL